MEVLSSFEGQPRDVVMGLVSGPKRLGRPDPASYQRCESTFWASVSSSDPCPFQRGLSMQSICDSVCGWQVPLGGQVSGRQERAPVPEPRCPCLGAGDEARLFFMF